jgi:hypothetical protein
MYQEFALLSPGYIASPFCRLGLGVVDRGRALVSVALNGPFTLMGHHMLILSRHCRALFADCSLQKKRSGARSDPRQLVGEMDLKRS